LTARIPAHGGAGAGPGGFDHRVLADREAHAFAGLDEMVAEVAVACQPDTRVDSRQLAAEASEAQRLTGSEALEGGVRLRVHHQSPVLRVGMIVVPAQTIQ
jgi:hypothetical protein